MIPRRGLLFLPLFHTKLPLSYVYRRRILLRTPPTSCTSRNTPLNTIPHIPGTLGVSVCCFPRLPHLQKWMYKLILREDFFFLMGTWESHTCVIANVYIPPPFNLTVLQRLSRFLAKQPQVLVYVLGDFNSALDTFLDVHRKYCPQGPRTYTALTKYVTEIGLFDLWRCKFPLKSAVFMPFINTFYPVPYRLCLG